MKLRIALGALLVALIITAALSTSNADAGDKRDERDYCIAACKEQVQACNDVCREYPNPVECQSDCRDAGQDCYIECD